MHALLGKPWQAAVAGFPGALWKAPGLGQSPPQGSLAREGLKTGRGTLAFSRVV